MSRDDGGPAFPELNTDCGYRDSGMSLRDYFAAKAMQAMMMPAPNGNPWPAAGEYKGIAIAAYDMADKMLEARK